MQIMSEKTLSIVVGHPDNEIQISAMDDIVNQLRKTPTDILICAHCEIPDFIKEKVDYTIVDLDNNQKITKRDLPYAPFKDKLNNITSDISDEELDKKNLYDQNYIGFGTSQNYWDDDRGIRFNAPMRPHPWHYAALKNVENGIKFAKKNGYKYFNYMEADFKLHDDEVDNLKKVRDKLIDSNKKLYCIYYNDNIHKNNELIWGISMELLIGEVDFFHNVIRWPDTLQRFKDNCFSFFLDTVAPAFTWAHELSIEAYVYESIKWARKLDLLYNETDDILAVNRSHSEPHCSQFPKSKLNTSVTSEHTGIVTLVVDKNNIERAGIFCLARRGGNPVRYQYILTKDGVIQFCKDTLPEQWVDGNYFFEEFYLDRESQYRLQVIAPDGGGVSRLHKKLIYEQSFTVSELVNYTDRGKMFPCEYEYTK